MSSNWLLSDEEIKDIPSGATTLRRLNSADGKRMRDWKAVATAEAKHLMHWLDTAGLLQHRVGGRSPSGAPCPVCQIMRELGLEI